MDKKIIKGLKRPKIVNKDYLDAISRLKQASMNSKASRKSRYEPIQTEKLLSANGIGKHVRHISQVNNPHMRNLSRILSPSRSNNRSTSMKRKNSIAKGLKYNKSKVAKLQMSYISPMNESKDSSIKRFNSSNKLTEKDSFPKIKPKGFQSYLSSNNLSQAVAKMNSRKSRIVNKSHDFMIKTTKPHDVQTVMNVSSFISVGI